MKLRVILIKGFYDDEEAEADEYELQEQQEFRPSGDYLLWERVGSSFDSKEEAIAFAKRYIAGEVTEDGNEVVWSNMASITEIKSEGCPNHCDIHELQKPLPPILDKPGIGILGPQPAFQILSAEEKLRLSQT